MEEAACGDSAARFGEVASPERAGLGVAVHDPPPAMFGPDEFGHGLLSLDECVVVEEPFGVGVDECRGDGPAEGVGNVDIEGNDLICGCESDV